MGHRFFESTMPRIATALEKIAVELEARRKLDDHLIAEARAALEGGRQA
jgi:hypothetical protein